MMKLSKSVLFLFLLLSSGLSAQITYSDPISYRMDLNINDDALEEAYTAQPLDMAMVNSEVERHEREGLPQIDGWRIPAGLNMNNHGQWFDLENGDRIWKLRVHSPGALSLEFFYDDFYLPQGAEMHLYNPDRSAHLGAYTAANNTESGYYSTGMIDGETTIIEYYEPAAVAGQGRMGIQDVGHRFLDFPRDARAEDCQVDVNCDEGEDWQDEKRGVVYLRVSAPGGATYMCSGSLINNTAEDCTPYVLSAFHCVDNVINNQTYLNQLRFVFNFERAGCGSGYAPQSHFRVGCTVAARSHGGSGSGSDFVLLLINDDIPENYNAYWNGWNLQSTTISGGGVGIHHPSGKSKKISTSTSNFVTTSYDWGGPQAYWRVYWAATENGHGVTEGGSSGSPLFDNNGLIVGTLTGGSSFCNSVQPGGQTQPDWYGKMSYHWNSNSGSQTTHLRGLLDPLNTGQTVLMGGYAPCEGSASSIDESDEAIAELLSIYPNPTHGAFSVDLAGYESEIDRITIYSVVGRRVAELPVDRGTLQLDLTEQPAGMYIVTFHFSDRPAISQKIARY